MEPALTSEHVQAGRIGLDEAEKLQKGNGAALALPAVVNDMAPDILHHESRHAKRGSKRALREILFWMNRDLCNPLDVLEGQCLRLVLEECVKVAHFRG